MQPRHESTGEHPGRPEESSGIRHRTVALGPRRVISAPRRITDELGGCREPARINDHPAFERHAFLTKSIRLTFTSDEAMTRLDIFKSIYMILRYAHQDFFSFLFASETSTDILSFCIAGTCSSRRCSSRHTLLFIWTNPRPYSGQHGTEDTTWPFVHCFYFAVGVD